MPDMFVIGGANGAGKTTAAMTLLSQYLDVFEFVNADEIARGLNPLRPTSASIPAGRIMLQRLQDLIAARTNFAFETTCAGHYHIQTINDAKAAGYTVTLVFLWLPSGDMAVQRVGARVQQGGHDIPETTIRRRYIAGLQNLLEVFLPLVDQAIICENTGTDNTLVKIAEKTAAGMNVFSHDAWESIIKTARKINHE